jgi:two-component system sensor histidine kinase QseC
MKSIKRFQIVALVSGTAVLIAAGQYLHYRTVRGSLYAKLDETLAAKASALASLMEYDPPDLEFDFTPETSPEFAREVEPEYFEVRVDTRLHSPSPSLSEGSLLPEDGGSGAPIRWNTPLPDGRPGRAYAATFHVVVEDTANSASFDAPQARIAIAVGRGGLEATLAQILFGIIMQSVVVIGAVALLIWWTIRLAMAPLRAMSTETGAIDVESLDHRFESERLPVELQPIASAMNRLLDRLEKGFERERRTTANIAHELRTPIAELRSATEVALRGEGGEASDDDDDALRRTIVTAQEISVEMGRIVEALLLLARVNAEGTEAEREDIELASVSRACWSRLEEKAAQSRIVFDANMPDSIAVRVNRDALSLMLSNLMANAIDHSPTGSTVHCTASTNGSLVEFTISNPSDAITGEDLPQLIEPFWTKDASRTDRSHTGLGLALVASAGEAIGVGVDFEVGDGQFHARLTFS